MSEPATAFCVCVCAEMFDEGIHKLYSIPVFIIPCSVQKCAYFHNTACYSHLLYFSPSLSKNLMWSWSPVGCDTVSGRVAPNI